MPVQPHDRSPEQLREQRRQAREDFERSRSGPVEVGPIGGAARETRREKERLEAVRRRERSALLARLEDLGAGDDDAATRVVLVHRVAWTRQALGRGLVEAGLRVVEVDDGAAGLGTVVAEQPDLVVVQEQLPWKDGLDVVREVRRFAPSARVAVHLDQPRGEERAREAGADVVFPRTTRPVDMVPALVALARG